MCFSLEHSRRFPRFRRLLFVAGVLAIVSNLNFAQSPTPTPSSHGSDPKAESADDDKSDQAKKKEKRGQLIPAPIPIHSPALGNGLILGLGYIFQFNRSDTISPPSTIGIAGAFTSNGSRGLGIGANLRFAENRYQTSFVIAKGRANYRFFGIGRTPSDGAPSVLIKQQGTVFFAEFMRNVWKNVFVGPRFQYRKLTASTDKIQTPGGFEIPAIDLHSTTAAIGFHIQQDNRDNTFYPRKGSL